MLCYLKIFATPLPVTAQIFNDEFVKIIEFDILNPEGIIKIFEKNFSMQKLLTGNPAADSSFPSLLNDMMTFIIMGCGFILFAFVLVFLYHIKKIKAFIIAKLKKLYEKTVWNGVIRSILIGYLKLLISVSA